MPTTLEKEKCYQVKILKVEPKTSRPTFPRNNATYYNFLITIETKQGLVETCEYASPVQDANVFIVKNPPIYQWIKCINPNEKGSEIEPFDLDEDKRSRIEQARQIAAGGPVTQTAHQPQPTMDQRRPQNYSVAGHPFAFALAYAKDLKIAEMKEAHNSHIMQPDLDDIIEWAEFFEAKLREKLLEA